MLDLEQIATYYPEQLRPFKKNILREYIQYKLLEAIYSSEFGRNMVFMGGTAVRILHENKRFSEDLDFDNNGMDQKTFISMSKLALRALEREGLKAELKNVFKCAYHAYIGISDILHSYGISHHQEEKITIQLDMEAQNADYKPDHPFINKFDVFLRINAVPVNTLLSQKIYAFLNRKRVKGRDIFDISFLLGKTRPDYNYIDQKTGINNSKDLRTKLLNYCDKLDLKVLARDVEPFLFEPKEKSRVSEFKDFIASAKLD